MDEDEEERRRKIGIAQNQMLHLMQWIHNECHDWDRYRSHKHKLPPEFSIRLGLDGLLDLDDVDSERIIKNVVWQFLCDRPDEDESSD
jgi:hypothetical protein